ncbi:MAG: AbrB/MazE/SpoVT family DNA-binding domain-containing protein [Candidatus Micrarchaeota archaeon]
MSEVLTTVSSRGQIVIPEEIRKQTHLVEGSKLVVFARNDTIVLKMLQMPSATEVFSDLTKWGKEFAQKRGITNRDVEAAFAKRGKKVKLD